MKKILFAACIIFLAVAVFMPCGNDGVLRLRVIANSDSESDQSIKSEVAEAVGRLFEENNFGSVEEAEEWIGENLSEIEIACRSVIGSGNMTLELKDEVYSDGEWRSLVVTLGRGEGHNFWGTVFPDVLSHISSVRGKGNSFGTVVKNGNIVEIRLWIADLLGL